MISFEEAILLKIVARTFPNKNKGFYAHVAKKINLQEGYKTRYLLDSLESRKLLSININRCFSITPDGEKELESFLKDFRDKAEYLLEIPEK